MKLSSSAALAAVLAIGTVAAHAQQGQTPTTVQLPTYSHFGVNTSVLVPDRGSASLGGVNRSAEGRTEAGIPFLPGNRAIGRDLSASNVSVSVYVHDFEAMDRALLSEPTEYRAELARRQARQAAAAASEPSWPSARAEAAVKSVAELRAEREQVLAERASEADRYWARGQAAESQGKPGVARVYYQMVARRASGALREQALARLAVLAENPPARVAQAAR